VHAREHGGDAVLLARDLERLEIRLGVHVRLAGEEVEPLAVGRERTQVARIDRNLDQARRDAVEVDRDRRGRLRIARLGLARLRPRLPGLGVLVLALVAGPLQLVELRPRRARALLQRETEYLRRPVEERIRLARAPDAAHDRVEMAVGEEP